MLTGRSIALAAAVAALLAGEASAQASAARPVTIGPLVGFMKFDEAAALDNAALAGLSATYRVRGGLSVGAYLEGTRTSTLGNYFPAAKLTTGGVSGTTQLFYVSQRVTVMNYGLRAQYGRDFGRANAYLGVGLGQWTIFPDVQQNANVDTFSNLSWETGAGVGIPLGESAGLRLDVRAVHFRKYVRENLNAVIPTSRNTLYPDVQDFPLDVPSPECGGANWCSMLNWRFGAAFVFYPQRAGR
jgi:outer membrane protein W